MLAHTAELDIRFHYLDFPEKACVALPIRVSTSAFVRVIKAGTFESLRTSPVLEGVGVAVRTELPACTEHTFRREQ